MKKFLRLIMMMAIFSFAIINCDKGSPGLSEPEEEPGDDPTETNGNMQSLELLGLVKDTDGNPLSGVKVSTGDLTTTTKQDGTFTFDKAEVIDKRAVILFEKREYFSVTRSGVKENEMFIEAVMHPKGNSTISLQTEFNSSEGKLLQVPAGMKVDLASSSIKRADGSAYSGRVNADMLYLDPNNPNFSSMMPGGDLAAITENNDQVMLVSWGMTEVSLTDDDGNPLQLISDKPATLTYPIPAGMENNPPPTIPLWHFDDEKGIWKETGIAKLEGNVYVGEVTHFSWVNLDVPAERVTVRGKVVCDGNKPVPYVEVKVGQTGAITNSKGEYSAFIPENTQVTVSVTANGGSDFKIIPQQPGNTTYNVEDLIVPCSDDDDPGEFGTSTHVEKAAIKYLIEGGTYFVITFDGNGKRFRWDIFDEEYIMGNQMVYIVNHITQTFCWGAGGYWVDEYDAYDPSINYFASIFSIEEEYLSEFKQPGTISIAGKACNHYIIPSGGTSVVYGVWNGLVLLLEINDDVFLLAQDVTLEVPNVAFTKTFNITWLP
ncbi:MAG: hypothetical protein FWH18_00185 [Marinilabiliaceae bacterium]|nr:hypothetical protein [Marinilabiliaceae bacterium]